MFRVISIAVLLVIFAGIALHHAASGGKRSGQKWRPIDILRGLVFLLTLLFLEQRLGIVGKLRKLIYLLAMLCFVVLAITGFYPALVWGEELSGYLLMVHVTAGGAFAACLALLALMWAHNCRFNADDLYLIVRRFRKELKNDMVSEAHPVQKAAFWLAILLALPVFLSIVLSMFPLFGTWWQYLLAEIHRYGALAFACVAIVHTCSMAASRRPGQR